MSDEKVDWEKFDEIFASRCTTCQCRQFQLKVEIDMIPLSLPTGMKVICTNCGKAYMIEVSRFLGDEPAVKKPIAEPIRVWAGREAPVEFKVHQEDNPLWLAHIPARVVKDKNFYFPTWLERIDSVSEPKRVELPDGSLLVFGNR